MSNDKIDLDAIRARWKQTDNHYRYPPASMLKNTLKDIPALLNEIERLTKCEWNRENGRRYGRCGHVKWQSEIDCCEQNCPLEPKPEPPIHLPSASSGFGFVSKMGTYPDAE